MTTPQVNMPPTPKNQGSQKELTSTLEPPGHSPAQANLEGRGIHRRALARFIAEPPAAQHKELRDTWKAVAMVAASRAKGFAATCSPKDFGRLYQLIMSGAVSIDKAFPPKEQAASPRLVVNLFGSLGERAAKIAIPPVPQVIDVTPQPQEGSTSNEQGVQQAGEGAGQV